MKKFLSFLFVLFFGFTLAACTGPTQDDGKIQVTFWHAMGQSNQVLIQKMIDSFEAKYPNVNVEQYNQGGYDDLLEKVKNNIKSGTTPTIAQTYPDHVTSYLTSKTAVVNLNNYIYDEEVGFDALGISGADYVDSFWAEGTSYGTDGSMYSLPFNKSTEVTIYNQDIFNKYDWFVTLLGLNAEEVYETYAANEYDADGKVTKYNTKERTFKKDFVWHPTWEQLEKIGEAFKATAEYKSCIDAGLNAAAVGYDSQSNLFITLTQQLAALDGAYGVKGQEAYTRLVGNGQGEFTFLNEDNPYARAAVRYYKEQYDRKNFVTSGTLGADYCSDAFKGEQCVVTIGSSGGAHHNSPDGTFTPAVATYPQWEAATEDQYQVIQQGTNITLFTQPDKEVEKYGWLFMCHMISYECSLIWSTGNPYFPIRKDVISSEEYQNFLEGVVYEKDEETGEIKKDENGNPMIDSDAALTQLSAKIAWTQNQWFYTNVAFNGTDISRAKIELLIQNVLLNESTQNLTVGSDQYKAEVNKAIEEAFATCKDALKNYIANK